MKVNAVVGEPLGCDVAVRITHCWTRICPALSNHVPRNAWVRWFSNQFLNCPGWGGAGVTDLRNGSENGLGGPETDPKSGKCRCMGRLQFPPPPLVWHCDGGRMGGVGMD